MGFIQSDEEPSSEWQSLDSIHPARWETIPGTASIYHVGHHGPTADIIN